MTNKKNARLAEELRQRAKELAKSNQAIARISERLSTLSDLSAFLGQVAIEAAKQLDADAGHLTVFDEKNNALQTVALFEADELIKNGDIPVCGVSEENAFWRELRELRPPRQICAVMEADLFRQGSIKWRQPTMILKFYSRISTENLLKGKFEVNGKILFRVGVRQHTYTRKMV